MTRAPCRRRTGEARLRAEKFGYLITADHKVLTRKVNLETITDTQSWYKILPLNGFNLIRAKQNFSANGKVFVKLLGANEETKVIYTDNSLEFGKSCEESSWNHCTSTPHRSETNGIAEGAVRRVKEGTSAVLLQSGLDEKLVGTFHGMLLLSANCPRPPCRRENSV